MEQARLVNIFQWKKLRLQEAMIQGPKYALKVQGGFYKNPSEPETRMSFFLNLKYSSPACFPPVLDEEGSWEG